MAALRHAVRRLGGTVVPLLQQRSHAICYSSTVVAATEQRLPRCLPTLIRCSDARRPMSTSSSFRPGAPYGNTEFPGAKAAATEPDDEEKYARSRLPEIHQKKEELYDLEVEYEKYNAANEPFFSPFQKEPTS